MPIIIVTSKYVVWHYQTYGHLAPVYAGQFLEVLSDDDNFVFCQTLPDELPFHMLNIPKSIDGAYEVTEEQIP